MTTNSSTAAPAEAGHVSLMTGRLARARRSAGVVRYADAAGRTRTASADVASTFVELTEFDLDRDHGVAYIEAAGQGVRILTAITVDQHDAAFAGEAWPVVEPGQLHGAVRSRRVAIAGQWYWVTRVQRPSGELRRFARQYNGYGDGPADVREASMMFGCAWSSVPVVGVASPTVAGIVGTPATPGYSQAVAERVEANGLTAGANELLAELDRENRTDADIAAGERDAEHRHAADDEAARRAEDADREAAEQLAEFGEWGHSPADILAEPDVDTSGCSNPWHRGAALYARRRCSGCPPLFRVGQAVEVDTRYLTTEPAKWEPATVYAVGGRLGDRNIEVEYVAGGVAPVAVARVRLVEVVELPELPVATELLIARFAAESRDAPDEIDAAHAEALVEAALDGVRIRQVPAEAPSTAPINERMAVTLRYFNDPTPENAVPVRALRGQHTGTMQALKRRRLTEPIDVFPFTALTALGRQQLADYYRTDPQT